MAFSKNTPFQYSIRGLDRIVEEKGNQYVSFRRLAWAGADDEVDPSKLKYDIRKYATDADGKERMLKGVSFLSDDGPSELVYILIEEGFGDTKRILQLVQKRSDCQEAIRFINGENQDNVVDLNSLLNQ